MRVAVASTVFALVGLSSQRMGHAQTVQPVEPYRMTLAVHPEVGMWLTNGPLDRPGSTPVMGSVGVGAGLAFARQFEIAVEVGKVLSQSHAFAVGQGVAVVNVDVNAGWLAGWLVHYRYPESGAAFVAGAGTAFIVGGDFGTVPLLQLQLGFEVRSPSGFYLLAVGQMMKPLVTREWPDPSRCIAACPLRLAPGQPMAGPHVAIGYVF